MRTLIALIALVMFCAAFALAIVGNQDSASCAMLAAIVLFTIAIA